MENGESKCQVAGKARSPSPLAWPFDCCTAQYRCYCLDTVEQFAMSVTNVFVTIVEVPQTAPLAPYRSHVRSSSTTQSAIVRVDSDAGLTGWGEHNVNFLPNLS